MVFTQNLSNLPDIKKLQQICKSISALEIIMEQEWEMRYYSYNPFWDDKEEVFEMKSDCGENMLILFNKFGCVISGINDRFFDWKNNTPKIEDISEGLPKEFYDFIYNEPIKSRKSTFCIWRTIIDSEWNVGKIDSKNDDGSEDILDILDDNPEKYVEFCQDYYEKDVPLEVVKKIYQGEPITYEMVLELNDEVEDIESIKKELKEIKYPNTL